MNENKGSIANRYYRYSKIAESDFEVLLHQFCIGSTVAEAVKQSGVSTRSVKSVWQKIRMRLVNESDFVFEEYAGEIEVIAWFIHTSFSEHKIKIAKNAHTVDSVFEVNANKYRDGGYFVVGGHKTMSMICCGRNEVKKLEERIQGVVNTPGIRAVGKDGFITDQLWQHLVAETWLMNHEGRAYQSLKASLLTLPL